MIKNLETEPCENPAGWTTTFWINGDERKIPVWHWPSEAMARRFVDLVAGGLTYQEAATIVTIRGNWPGKRA